jgi:hypothetical protein
MLFSFRQFFLAWVFVCVLACSSFIFFLSFKKINVLQCVWATKTMTKKLTATPHKACVCWLLWVGQALAVPVRWAVFGFACCCCLYSTAGLYS